MKKHVKNKKNKTKTKLGVQVWCKFGASLLQTCTKLAPADFFFWKKNMKKSWKKHEKIMKHMKQSQKSNKT